MISLHCAIDQRCLLNSGSDIGFEVRLKVRTRVQVTFGTARTNKIFSLLGTA